MSSSKKGINQEDLDSEFNKFLNEPLSTTDESLESGKLSRRSGVGGDWWKRDTLAEDGDEPTYSEATATPAATTGDWFKTDAGTPQRPAANTSSQKRSFLRGPRGVDNDTMRTIQNQVDKGAGPSDKPAVSSNTVMIPTAVQNEDLDDMSTRNTLTATATNYTAQPGIETLLERSEKEQFLQNLAKDADSDANSTAFYERRLAELGQTGADASRTMNVDLDTLPSSTLQRTDDELPANFNATQNSTGLRTINDDADAEGEAEGGSRQNESYTSGARRVAFDQEDRDRLSVGVDRLSLPTSDSDANRPPLPIRVGGESPQKPLSNAHASGHTPHGAVKNPSTLLSKVSLIDSIDSNSQFGTLPGPGQLPQLAAVHDQLDADADVDIDVNASIQLEPGNLERGAAPSSVLPQRVTGDADLADRHATNQPGGNKNLEGLQTAELEQLRRQLAALGDSLPLHSELEQSSTGSRRPPHAPSTNADTRSFGMRAVQDSRDDSRIDAEMQYHASRPTERPEVARARSANTSNTMIGIIPSVASPRAEPSPDTKRRGTAQSSIRGSSPGAVDRFAHVPSSGYGRNRAGPIRPTASASSMQSGNGSQQNRRPSGTPAIRMSTEEPQVSARAQSTRPLLRSSSTHNVAPRSGPQLALADQPAAAARSAHNVSRKPVATKVNPATVTKKPAVRQRAATPSSPAKWEQVALRFAETNASRARSSVESERRFLPEATNEPMEPSVSASMMDQIAAFATGWRDEIVAERREREVLRASANATETELRATLAHERERYATELERVRSELQLAEKKAEILAERVVVPEKRPQHGSYRALQQQRALDSESKKHADAAEGAQSNSNGEANVEVKVDKDLHELDALYRASQAENARLYNEMKRLRATNKLTEQRLLEENAAANRHVADLRSQLEAKELETRQLRQQVLRHANAAGRRDTLPDDVETDDRSVALLRIKQLEAELKASREAERVAREEVKKMEERAREMSTRYELVVSEKRALDAKLAEQKDASVRECERIRSECTREADELRRKVRWFTENQSLVDSQLRTLRERNARIARLERDLETTRRELENTRGELVSSLTDKKNASKRRVRIGDENTAESSPVNGSQKTEQANSKKQVRDATEQRTREFLEEQVRKLENQLETQASEAKLAIRGSEQRFYATKQRYEDRIEVLERELRRRGVNVENRSSIFGTEKQSPDAEQPLETDNATEQRPQQGDSTQRSQTDANATIESQSTPKAEGNTAEKKPSVLGQKGSAKARHATILVRSANRGVVTREYEPSQFEPADADAIDPLEHARTLRDLSDARAACDAVRAQLDATRVELNETKVYANKCIAEAERTIRELRETHEEQLAALSEAHRNELERVVVKNAREHSVSRVAELQAKLDSHEVVLRHLQDQLKDAQAAEGQLKEARKRENELNVVIGKLKQDLQNAQSHYTPEMHHYVALQEKMNHLEIKLAERDAEVRRLVGEQTTRRAQMLRELASASESQAARAFREAEAQREEEIAKLREAVAEKQAQLADCQRQLDVIVELLKQLHRHGDTLFKSRLFGSWKLDELLKPNASSKAVKFAD